jgi:hypothetical protein
MSDEYSALEYACHQCKFGSNLVYGEPDQLLAMIAEIRRLRVVLANMVGDSLCRFTSTEEAASEAKAIPEKEFLESCRRYRNQIASERGEFDAGMTIAQLESNCVRLNNESAALRNENTALRKTVAAAIAEILKLLEE